VVDRNVAKSNGLETTPAATRRKISRSEWSTIGARHATGESLASIARHYRCTAPAIRYILNTERRLSGSDDTQAPEKHHVQKPYAALAAFDPLSAPQLEASETNASISTQGTVKDALGRSSDRSTVGFDLNLKEGMTLEISKFLVAFDAIFAGATPQALNRLREATDRLMRVTARVRIELERGLAPHRLD
jgi:hypothetical protein